MALNGSYRTGSSDDHYFEISWEVVKQSTTDNTSTLKWTATCENCRQANYDTLTFDVYYFYIKPGGGEETKYTLNIPAVTSTDKIITLDLGIITIPHTSTTETQYFRLSDISYRVRFSKSTGSGSSDGNEIVLDGSSYRGYYIEPVVPAVKVTAAPDFNDEENPTISYKKSYILEESTKVYAAISFTGSTDDVPYREISSSDTSYTFNLTDEERRALRLGITSGSVKTVRFYIKTTFSDGESVWHYLTRNLTLINHEPLLNPTVKDIKPETLALTGDENTFIRYASMAEYSSGAEARKEATLVSQSVTCGSKTVEGLPNGVIDDVESGTFIFNITDSRGFGASSSVFKNIIDYVKPTCYQKLEILLSGETSANIHLTVNGNYFNGSFGAIENTFKLEVRYTDDNGNMGAWQTLSGTPTFNGNTYKLEATFSGFTYEKAYTFQCRLTDKLNVVESAQYTTRVLPVFDWSETDFNFNVPVNIDAEDLSMHGETIIRHSDSTNNTVLSASNGNIYVRPGGTNSTSGETIFYANGNVKFNGTVTFADGSTGGGASDPTDAFADYVIDIGEEAMGSNGTWYWRKWNSGKAEAWGCRNFGNMAVTTAWGNLYRSAVFTQNLPNNVFIRTPDAININIVHSNYGGWICKHEQTAPSADTTGSFIFVRPASATVTPTNIGFYVVGEWK